MLKFEEGQTIDEIREEILKDRKRLEALKRLSENEDFNYLIFDEYIKNGSEEAVRILDSEQAHNNQKLKEMNEAKLIGISYIQRWFNYLIAAGNTVDDRLKQLDEFIDEVEEEKKD